MIGLLIYDEIGLKRNEWFKDELIRVCNKNNIALELFVLIDKDNFTYEKEIDFVINRSISPNVTKYFENKNIRVFNNYKTSFVANNKWETYLLGKKLNIDVMESRLSINDDFSFPFVFKTLNGHGGSEVFKVTSINQYNALREKYHNNYLIQKMASCEGVDIRVYSLKGEIIIAVKRQSNSDFRSNYSLGGNIFLFDATSEMENIVRKIYNELNFDFVGIDFIINNDKFTLNEIEDVVGTRMIYKLSDINIVDIFINYIKKELKDKKK